MCVFAKRLKRLRTEAEISQEELANVLGLAKSTISLYESGKRQPDYDVLLKIAEYFRCSTDYLLGNSNTIKTPEQKIAEAISDEPELQVFWQELSSREDLQLLFKQVRPLSPTSIKKIIGIIKTIYEETEDS